MDEELKNEFAKLYKYLDMQFSEVNKRLDKIEGEVPKDILSILRQVKKNTDSLNTDVEYLAGQLGKHEMIIKRFEQQ